MIHHTLLSRRSAPLLAASLAVAALVTGCSATPAPDATGAVDQTPAAAAPIRIVASTNVYGDIATQIGGTAVQVTSIIDDPSKDPHEYQADAQNQLALSKASIVIENGGGYDDFVDTMLSSANNTRATVLNVVDLSGFDQNPPSGSFNEHVWYDLPTIGTLADRLAAALSAVDPAQSATFEANAQSFEAKLGVLEQSEATTKSSVTGASVAITEPVPLYLLTAMGIGNKTPEAFSEAIEQGTDVAPTVLAQTLALFSSHQVRALVYNAQTTGAQTEAVLAAAQTAGIAVVPVTETLPAGDDYVSWMTGNITAITAAVSG